MCFNDNDKFEIIIKVPKFNISDKCSTMMIYVFAIKIQNDNVKI